MKKKLSIRYVILVTAIVLMGFLVKFILDGIHITTNADERDANLSAVKSAIGLSLVNFDEDDYRVALNKWIPLGEFLAMGDVNQMSINKIDNYRVMIRHENAQTIVISDIEAKIEVVMPFPSVQ